MVLVKITSFMPTEASAKWRAGKRAARRCKAGEIQRRGELDK
jgi:hypothetical protein